MLVPSIKVNGQDAEEGLVSSDRVVKNAMFQSSMNTDRIVEERTHRSSLTDVHKHLAADGGRRVSKHDLAGAGLKLN